MIASLSPPPPPPGQPQADPDMSGRWVTVADAVHLCAEMGLSRDIKTIRRWAQRSHARPENADVLVREQDTPTGFRYLIERTSLERKIAQEIAFEANRAEAAMSGQAPTEPDTPGPVHVGKQPEAAGRTGSDTPARVRPGMDTSAADETSEVRKLSVSSITADFLKDQIDEKDGQIAALNAQIERRDRQIDAMLERDRETNFLINTLQQTLSQAMELESPTRMRMSLGREGDNASGEEGRDRV